MIWGLVMLVVGLALSAFFSGSETGFYRVTRFRLLISAVSGDWPSKGLLWLINNPAFFVATTLIGNNLANYMTSLAVVVLTKQIVVSDASAVELTATILFSPLVFVYGELLPKYLFYNAPNRLLRLGGPLFLVFAVLFAPISAILGALGLVLRSLVGETPLRVQQVLARTELQEMLLEGQEVGILRPAQRLLAQSLFSAATRPIRASCRLPMRVPAADRSADRAELIRNANRLRTPQLVVYEKSNAIPVGYIRVVDLMLSAQDDEPVLRPISQLSQATPRLDALMRLQADREDLALVVDEQGRMVGVLFVDDLIDSLLSGPA